MGDRDYRSKRVSSASTAMWGWKFRRAFTDTGLNAEYFTQTTCFNLTETSATRSGKLQHPTWRPLMTRLRKTSTSLLALLTLISTLTSQPVSSVEGPEGGASVSRPYIQNSQADAVVQDDTERLRAEYGFHPAADVGLASGDLYLNEWGFVGTQIEDREMERREQVAIAVGPFVEALKNRPGFAGTYLEHSQSGRATKVFTTAGEPFTTEEKSSIITAVKNSGSLPTDVAFRIVAHSNAELEAFQDTLWKWGRQTNPGMLQSTSVSHETNTLVIQIRSRASETLVYEYMKSYPYKYTLEVGRTTEEVCTSRLACDSPQRAGIGIDRNGGVCTAGWIVVRDGQRGALTAAHCWHGETSGGVGSGGRGFGALTGITSFPRQDRTTSADMRFILVTNSRPVIYQSAAFKAEPVEGRVAPQVGEAACIFRRSAESGNCGKITDVSVRSYSASCGCDVYNLVQATYEATGGDSGSPIASSGNGHYALGIHRGDGVSGSELFSNLAYLSTYHLGSLVTQ